MANKSNPQACRDYRMTRRSLLSNTALGAAAGTFLGMPVRNLLAAAGKDHKPKCEHVILFWCGGGMSHLDTWDPKPGRPTQGEFVPIKTTVPGMHVTEIFPSLARQAHNFALIRSIAGQNGDHGRATYQLQTSYNTFPNLQHPGIGSVVVREKDRMSELPSYVAISGQAPRAGYLGQKCESYFVGRPGERDPYLAFPQGIHKVRGNKRLDLLAKMNAKVASQRPNAKYKADEDSIEDAVKLMRSPALKSFDLDKVDPFTLGRYGDSDFGRGALLARRLVENGVRFVQVNRGGFDTHGNNFPAMRNHGGIMDPALSALIEDLDIRGMLDTTMVIVLSEFGRTPRINNNAGRDHHAGVFSCFMAGGGISGGAVVGSSDTDGFRPDDRPVQVPDIHATICHAMGINYDKKVMTPLDRPMKLVDDGKPVMELFS